VFTAPLLCGSQLFANNNTKAITFGKLFTSNNMKGAFALEAARIIQDKFQTQEGWVNFNLSRGVD